MTTDHRSFYLNNFHTET